MLSGFLTQSSSSMQLVVSDNTNDVPIMETIYSITNVRASNLVIVNT